MTALSFKMIEQLNLHGCNVDGWDTTELDWTINPVVSYRIW